MGTTIIISARNEMYLTGKETVLQRTVRDIYEKATGEFEVIVTFDGPPFQDLPDYPNLTVVRNPVPIGLKPSINKMVEMAKHKYIIKTDAHCMFGYGFNEILQQDMENNWIVTPRFFVLDAEKWQIQDPWWYDYFYLSCPFTDTFRFGFKAGGHWRVRTQERKGKEFDIDETMQIHGSCWMVTKDYFLNILKGMQTDGYGISYMEPPELCLKTWLVHGGKVMVNKRTWYAHMHKGRQRGASWNLGVEEAERSYKWTAKHWMRNEEPGQIHKIEWLIDKFWPVPTWPDDWKEIYNKWLQS
jgi:hypothetical protein